MEEASKEFSDYLQQAGISHKLSCPKKLRKVWRAERKDRHITETALSLMFASQVRYLNFSGLKRLIQLYKDF